MAGFWAALPFIILFSSLSYCCVYATHFACETMGSINTKKFLMYKEVWSTVKPFLELAPLYLRKQSAPTTTKAQGVLAEP